LICTLTSILFLGGYLFNINLFFDLFYFLGFDLTGVSSTFFNSILSSLILGIKSSLMIFTFIWARASLPRIRFDQLMSFCWTVLLPIVVAFIILIPCILYAFDILPNSIVLL
jgi:NADH-ubiquinone oxidoreductase chain 1